MFFSMRCIWSGISKTLGYEKNESMFLLNLPVFICFALLFNWCKFFQSAKVLTKYFWDGYAAIGILVLLK